MRLAIVLNGYICQSKQLSIMRFLTTLVLVLTTAGAYAQPDAKAKANVRQAAINLGTALMSKHYDAFLSTTYPPIVEHTTGGKEKMLADIKKQVAAMERVGNTITAMWPGEPSAMVDTAGELQCTMPQFMKMNMPNGKLTTETTLVCISTDKGKTWYFIDAVDKNINEMRALFPNISSKLVLLPSPEPKFEPK